MHECRSINCFILVASKKQPATAENSLLPVGDPAAITSVTVAIRERVAIEPSPSDNPEGSMHAVDTSRTQHVQCVGAQGQ